MFLKEIQLYDERNTTNFNSESICVTEMFIWELGKKFETQNCEMVFFHCGDFSELRLVREEQDGYNFLVPKKSYDVELPFDQEKYKCSASVNKKQLMTEAVKEGMLYLSKLKGWNQNAINATIEKMYEKQLIHTFRPWKGKRSPNRKAKAYPVVNLDLNAFSVELVVENTKKEILKRTQIAITKPDLHDLSYFMKKLEWVNNDEVVLYTKANKGTFNRVIVSDSNP
ncbi:hypothetical protein GKZ89_18305 [Bacillus mangrovi]|uniref:Uncharacterized protein n=1 Tax=Metabacillus mangrovi TaxID=1491830 RepID=A0A7X2V6C1_9BACI|nr:hypothetical protein [Metabacillus mangrovi]MTH55350.1 hypothetical protein [Metabacillus mangrovi]